MEDYKYYDGFSKINRWNLAYGKQINRQQEQGKMESK
jgi:hypothetical protein